MYRQLDSSNMNDEPLRWLFVTYFLSRHFFLHLLNIFLLNFYLFYFILLSLIHLVFSNTMTSSPRFQMKYFLSISQLSRYRYIHAIKWLDQFTQHQIKYQDSRDPTNIIQYDWLLVWHVVKLFTQNAVNLMNALLYFENQHL